MSRTWCYLALGLVAAAIVVAAALTTLSPGAKAAHASDTTRAAPRVVLADTYSAVTKVHFTNTSVHKGSHKPGLVKRRFRADVKYWLMDAKYYDRGELSIGNPTLVDFVQKVGGKDLPSSEPTTLPATAYAIAEAVLDEYPIIQRVEVRLTHFSKGLDSKDESEDNHVVNIVLQR
jgi:hypothetical protein